MSETDWSQVEHQDEPIIAYNTFFEIFQNQYDAYCPVVSKKSKNKRLIPRNPWLTKGLLISRQTKEKLLRDKTLIKTQDAKDKFYTYNSIYTKLIKRSKKMHYVNKFSEARGDCKKTWNLLREVLGRDENNSKCDIPSAFKQNGVILSGEKVAEGFNAYFSSVGQDIAKHIPSPKQGACTYLKRAACPSFKFQELCSNSILHYALLLKDKTSLGFDGVSSHVVRRIAPAIVEPLCHLFNLSLKTGFIPQQFKIARVIPLFKSGKKTISAITGLFLLYLLSPSSLS